MQRTPRAEHAAEASLGDTIGSEDAVLVVVDPAELPRAWATVDTLAEVIGDSEYRLTASTTLPGALRDTAPAILSSEEARALRCAAESVRGQAKVTFGDYHLDAKLFPHLHPYGSGSLRAEPGSGGRRP